MFVTFAEEGTKTFASPCSQFNNRVLTGMAEWSDSATKSGRSSEEVREMHSTVSPCKNLNFHFSADKRIRLREGLREGPKVERGSRAGFLRAVGPRASRRK
jgi:hypothetical protein